MIPVVSDVHARQGLKASPEQGGEEQEQDGQRHLATHQQLSERNPSALSVGSNHAARLRLQTFSERHSRAACRREQSERERRANRRCKRQAHHPPVGSDIDAADWHAV
jgi:hypothetical protein